MKVSSELVELWNSDGRWKEVVDGDAVRVESVDDGDDLVRVRLGHRDVVVDGRELIAAVEKAIGLNAVRRGQRR